MDVRFDVILERRSVFFPRAWLDQGIYAEVDWDARASGVQIPDPIAEQPEKDWAQFLQQSASR